MDTKPFMLPAVPHSIFAHRPPEIGSQVFDEKHTELFGRPEVSADRIVMCHEMMKAISDKSDKINNTLFGKYGITKHALLYMLRIILETDPLGKDLLVNPATYVRLPKDREYFDDCVSKIVDDMIIDVNAEVDELDDNSDYRGKLRDESWVKNLSKSVVGNYQKLVQRKRIDSFSTEWNRQNQ